jgi:endonuclease III
MKKQERANITLQRLVALYPDPPIPLDHTDEFTLLVAVLLSAQCPDKKVNEITPELFRVGGTPEKMMAMGAEKILSIIRPLGLSTGKSKNLARLSEILVTEHDSLVPRTFEELESLPGVGHKTASVVMAQAFGVPAFPVDTHIHRLAHRWGLSDGTTVEQTERDLKRLFPVHTWNKLHLQIIYYGREHCTARGCNGMICGLCRELFPNRKKPIVHQK